MKTEAAAALMSAALLAPVLAPAGPAAGAPPAGSGPAVRTAAGSAEVPLLPAGVTVGAGPLSLLDPRVDLQPDLLRAMAMHSAVRQAKAAAVRKLTETVSAPGLRDWMLSDVRLTSRRVPAPADPPGAPDPVLADWWNSAGPGRGMSYAADDPVIVRAELDVLPVEPSLPPNRGKRETAAYKKQFDELLVARRRNLAALARIVGAAKAELLCEAEFRGLDAASAAGKKITDDAYAFLEKELKDAGLAVARLVRADGREEDAKLFSEAAGRGTELVVLVKIRETEGKKTAGRNKSAGIVEMAVYDARAGAARPSRPVLGSSERLFTSSDSDDTPADAAGNFVGLAVRHLVADGRLVEALSGLLPVRWAEKAER